MPVLLVGEAQVSIVWSVVAAAATAMAGALGAYRAFLELKKARLAEKVDVTAAAPAVNAGSAQGSGQAFRSRRGRRANRLAVGWIVVPWVLLAVAVGFLYYTTQSIFLLKDNENNRREWAEYQVASQRRLRSQVGELEQKLQESKAALAQERDGWLAAYPRQMLAKHVLTPHASLVFPEKKFRQMSAGMLRVVVHFTLNEISNGAQSVSPIFVVAAENVDGRKEAKREWSNLAAGTTSAIVLDMGHHGGGDVRVYAHLVRCDRATSATCGASLAYTVEVN